jgi:hypothetical protein
MQESTQDSRERGEGQEQAGSEHPGRVNQQRHEPMPASHHADNAQAAPARNEEHSAAKPQHSAVQGDAVRDMMGGPPPQGDVPDAPGIQIAATEDGQDSPVRYVANAVPGKPDGEVDTRS